MVFGNIICRKTGSKESTGVFPVLITMFYYFIILRTFNEIVNYSKLCDKISNIRKNRTENCRLDFLDSEKVENLIICDKKLNYAYMISDLSD